MNIWLVIELVVFILHSLFDIVPVDKVPEILDIIAASVLIIKVICVFPYIDTHERSHVAGNGIACIWLWHNLQHVVGIECQPYPARTKERGCGV